MSGTITPPIFSLTAFSPTDTDDCQIDFTDKLNGAIIANIVQLVVSSPLFSVKTPTIVAGPTGAANSAVEFVGVAGTLSAPGTLGSYTVYASIVTSDGRDLTRSVIIPVQAR